MKHLFPQVRLLRTLATLLAAPLMCSMASAEVPSLKQVFQEHFEVGTAINRSFTTGTGWRRTPDQVAGDIALVKFHFNQITAENDMKWAMLHPRPGSDGYDFASADAFVDFGVQQQMTVVGHVLVWHSQTPNWVFQAADAPPPQSNPAADGPGGGGFRPRFAPFTGPKTTREELLKRMQEHITTVVGRYKGRVKAWDVVNEALSDGGPDDLRKSLWLEIIGPDFIARAFEYAHAADPQAILRYNDYGLENPEKRRKILSLIRSLQDQKVPIHAIGTQAHVNANTTFEGMDQCLTEIATLGLPIHVTELDVNTAERGQRSTSAEVADNSTTTGGGAIANADQKQVEAYAGIFRAFLKHRDTVKMVTFWGANDALSWRRQGKPLLFDGNNQPKAAFDAVVGVARKAAP